MEYVRAYGIELSCCHDLIKIDRPARTAWFKRMGKDAAGEVERRIDMLHVMPQQKAPDFVRSTCSPPRADGSRSTKRPCAAYAIPTFTA